MRDVLFVSKPVVPPWNDSNKNLVRDVSRSLRRYRARVLVSRGAAAPEGTVAEPLYAAAGSYAPSRWANARVLARLVTGPSAAIWHFFFAPNPLTLRAGRFASSLRRTPTVHTIASAPDDLERVAPLLFADRVVALSQHTARRLDAVGVRHVVIPPALGRPVVTPDAIDAARAAHSLPASYVLFPGDLEFGDGARTFVRAAARARQRHWVVASRLKTPRAVQARAVLEDEARALGATITWLGEVRDIHAVVAGASCVVLVSNTLHAKMDWPLVLLEALALEVPVLVASGTAADELVASGAATAVAPGDDAGVIAALDAWESRGNDAANRATAAARAWVEATCGLAVVAAAHEALYDELLAARAAPA